MSSVRFVGPRTIQAKQITFGNPEVVGAGRERNNLFQVCNGIYLSLSSPFAFISVDTVI